MAVVGSGRLDHPITRRSRDEIGELARAFNTMAFNLQEGERLKDVCADVAASGGQTILTVATENGIKIPTMCHLDGLSDTGSCRLCVVEVAGRDCLAHPLL